MSMKYVITDKENVVQEGFIRSGVWVVNEIYIGFILYAGDFVHPGIIKYTWSYVIRN